MAEAGGPTTHAGIFYQNTIAGLYLGRMLDLRPRAARDRVIRVRLEAPEAVDDLVAEMGDGSRAFLQVKLDISVGSDAWVTLWRNFKSQMENPSFASEDHLRLVLGAHGQLAAALRGASDRATAATDVSEWQRRLTEVQKRVVRGIAEALDDLEDGHPSVWRILTRSVVEVVPDDTVERDYTPLWMPESGSEPKHLLSALRDVAGGASRIRATFDAPTLRIRLREECGIEIREPAAWGAGVYRETVINSASVVVPGASQTRPVSDAFLWPHASRYDKSRQPDFDDEIPRAVVGIRTDDINLMDFGSPGLDKVVVIAGPGMGKSQLVVALSHRAAMDSRLPVIASIPELSRLDLEIPAFLEQEVNRRFQINVDWHAAAESGLLEIYGSSSI